MPEPRYLVVARIQRPHGVRGEMRAAVITSYPEVLATHQSFFLAPPESPESAREYAVEQVRLHSGVALLKLGGCDDRNEAESLRGMLVLIPTDRAVPLGEGEYYHHQIIGLRVETEDGERLGSVVEVLETGADDVYVIRGLRGEILVPAISDVVQEIDVAEGRMVIRMIPGLLGDGTR